MSKKGNPAIIGGFVLGAIVLAVFAVGFLGAVKFNTKEQNFVLFFAESVNGLEPGSKVKFQGITIGKVNDIRIRHKSAGENNVLFENQKDLRTIYVNGKSVVKQVALVPVYVSIDLTRLDEMNVLIKGEVDLLNIQKLCSESGLRAQLQTENMISGVKFIELNFFTEEQLITKFEADRQGKPFYGQVYPRTPEIPTVPSFQKSAEQLFNSFSKLDVEAIQGSLLETMNSLQRATNAAETKLGKVDMEGISANLQRALASFDSAVTALDGRLQDPKIDVVLADLSATLASYNQLASDVNAKINPVLENLEQTNKDAQNALRAMEGAGNRIQDALAPEAALRVELQAALGGIAEATGSIKRLVDYLERNPNALLTGRAPTSLPQ